MNTCQLRAQHMFSWSRYCDWLLIMISHEPRALKETRWGFTRLHWACFINTWIIKSHCQVHLRPNSLSASPLIHRFLPHLLWSLILLPFFIFKAPVCHTHLCMNIFFFFLPQVGMKMKSSSTLLDVSRMDKPYGSVTCFGRCWTALGNSFSA